MPITATIIDGFGAWFSADSVLILIVDYRVAQPAWRGSNNLNGALVARFLAFVAVHVSQIPASLG